jgi:mRNA-degrading endonuclease toxin of MazEF toxin-antitoxin module
VSPDELNEHLRTVIVAPMTTDAGDQSLARVIRFWRLLRNRA